MKKLLLAFFVLSHYETVLSQDSYWQQELKYTIDVSLNDTLNTLDGFLRLQYTNHSPDSLGYIWFHLWPNAFKNDRTAFSEQLLKNGRTDFYFSKQEERGYINRLDFRMNNVSLTTEDHPLYIDVVKVLLERKIGPGESAVITTPFHVKIPFQFSRLGHKGQFYAITQWYPKPAVYDAAGWHPMPYLDQGEFYGEFASYDVRIRLPGNYVVASTGNLVNEDDSDRGDSDDPNKDKNDLNGQSVKTWRFRQSDVHDFAWFADKEFVKKTDTLQLPSGKIIDVNSYVRGDDPLWASSLSAAKKAILFRSSELGEYPYQQVSVVQGIGEQASGMEYPTITLIKGIQTREELELIIEHEIGHNWFYGILASNERQYPWMDEGMNTYYDNRYSGTVMKNEVSVAEVGSFMKRRLPADPENWMLKSLAALHLDQPVNLPADRFTEINYNLIPYYKTALWMGEIEQRFGTERFSTAMKEYYVKWKFRHPVPKDFQFSLDQSLHADLDTFFTRLNESGTISNGQLRKKWKPAFLFNFKGTDSIRYLNFIPAIGFNFYDKLMAGVLVHNFNLPLSRLDFAMIPLYAFGSKKLNGLVTARYTGYPGGKIGKFMISLSGGRFSMDHGVDSNGKKIFSGFYRIVPSITLFFRKDDPLSTVRRSINWKTFFIGERNFNYTISSADSFYYPYLMPVKTRYVNQLSATIEDFRVLYPYDIRLQLQQGSNFYRADLSSHYFFNYADGGGMQARFFASKFGYIGTSGRTEAFVYQPKLTANTGSEDYTYGNYFIGRNEFDGFPSRQIMVRDGGLKLRTDLFYGYQGRTENWLSALNLNTTLPAKMLPFKNPFRLFLDVGTYAEAWKKNAGTSRFLFVGGIQLSLLRNIINIYAPLIYSSEFRDVLKTVPEENTFSKRISFSIDLNSINIGRITHNKVVL